MSSVVAIFQVVLNWVIAIIPKLGGIFANIIPYINKIFPIIGKIIEWILKLPTKEDNGQDPIKPVDPKECKCTCEKHHEKVISFCKHCTCEKCQAIKDEMNKKMKLEVVKDDSKTEF